MFIINYLVATLLPIVALCADIICDGYFSDVKNEDYNNVFPVPEISG